MEEIAETTLREYGFLAFLVVVLLCGLWLIIKRFLDHQSAQDKAHAERIAAQEKAHSEERAEARREFSGALAKIVDDARSDKEAMRKEAADEHKQWIGLFADLRDRIHCIDRPQPRN